MTHLDVSHQVKTYFILEHKKGKNRKNKMLCRCAVWEHCVFFFCCCCCCCCCCFFQLIC